MSKPTTTSNFGDPKSSDVIIFHCTHYNPTYGWIYGIVSATKPLEGATATFGITQDEKMKIIQAMQPCRVEYV